MDSSQFDIDPAKTEKYDDMSLFINHEYEENFPPSDLLNKDVNFLKLRDFPSFQNNYESLIEEFEPEKDIKLNTSQNNHVDELLLLQSNTFKLGNISISKLDVDRNGYQEKAAIISCQTLNSNVSDDKCEFNNQVINTNQQIEYNNSDHNYLVPSQFNKIGYEKASNEKNILSTNLEINDLDYILQPSMSSRWRKETDRCAFAYLTQKLKDISMDMQQFLFGAQPINNPRKISKSENIFDEKQNTISCKLRNKVMHDVCTKFNWLNSECKLFIRFRKLFKNQSFSFRDIKLLKRHLKMQIKENCFDYEEICSLFPGKTKETILNQLRKEFKNKELPF